MHGVVGDIAVFLVNEDPIDIRRRAADGAAEVGAGQHLPGAKSGPRFLKDFSKAVHRLHGRA